MAASNPQTIGYNASISRGNITASISKDDQLQPLTELLKAF